MFTPRNPAVGIATEAQMLAAIEAPPIWNCCQSNPKYVGVWGDGSGTCSILCGSCAWSFRYAGNTVLAIPGLSEATEDAQATESTPEPLQAVPGPSVTAESPSEPAVHVAISMGENTVVIGVFLDRDRALAAIREDIENTFAYCPRTEVDSAIRTVLGELSSGEPESFWGEPTLGWSLQTPGPVVRQFEIKESTVEECNSNSSTGSEGQIGPSAPGRAHWDRANELQHQVRDAERQYGVNSPEATALHREASAERAAAIAEGFTMEGQGQRMPGFDRRGR